MEGRIKQAYFKGNFIGISTAFILSIKLTSSSSTLLSTAHPERPERAHGSQLTSPVCWFSDSCFETCCSIVVRAFSWIIWILVAPTVMAICMVSFSSSSVASCFLATARQYCVQGSHPAAREAARAIRCLVLTSMAPSL